MASRTLFDIAPGTSMAGTVATFTAPVTGALLITVAVSANETLQIKVQGRTAQNYGGGMSLGANRVNTFVQTVVRDRIYEMTFDTGAGTIEFLTGIMETDQVS